MKITLLGTGTSQGVPVIGCECEVCVSTDRRDKRLRTAALVEADDHVLAIDAGPDFRQQMLRENVQKLDAVLLTHEHTDHMIGLDDVRPFNFRYRRSMPIYATRPVQKELRDRFAYAFAERPYPGAPSYELRTISKEEPFSVNGMEIQPVEVIHGRLPVLGFRFGAFTYITDAKTIAPEELEKIRGTEVLVLNALHHQEHYSHLNLEQALALIRELRPRQAWLTHISHHMGLHEKINQQLPENVALAYDGLCLEI